MNKLSLFVLQFVFRIKPTVILFYLTCVLLIIAACAKDEIKMTPSEKIRIDSLAATYDTVKAWDTTTITCYATGDSIVYSWECDHGNFNGSGTQIRYAAGECCVGTNTITCTITNISGSDIKDIQIVVTSYFGGGK